MNDVFEIGDIVIVQYEPDVEVHPESIVANLEGSVYFVKEKHKDEYGKIYYFLEPIKLKIKRQRQYYNEHMKAWWRDDFLKFYEEKPFEIDNMKVFLDA